MSMYATLEEAIDIAPRGVSGSISRQQQKGRNSVSATIHPTEICPAGRRDHVGSRILSGKNDATKTMSFRTGEAAQAIFDGDYDETELRLEWQEENTLHKWDEGEYQYESPLDTEGGKTASDEWDTM